MNSLNLLTVTVHCRVWVISQNTMHNMLPHFLVNYWDIIKCQLFMRSKHLRETNTIDIYQKYTIFLYYVYIC